MTLPLLCSKTFHGFHQNPLKSRFLASRTADSIMLHPDCPVCPMGVPTHCLLAHTGIFVYALPSTQRTIPRSPSDLSLHAHPQVSAELAPPPGSPLGCRRRDQGPLWAPSAPVSPIPALLLSQTHHPPGWESSPHPRNVHLLDAYSRPGPI